MPNIVNVTPQPSQTGVVLGLPVIITFDSLMNHSTITSKTFVMSCPSGTQILTPEQYISSNPTTLQAVGYVAGTFSYDDTSGSTVVKFTPNSPLKPNTQYNLLILGSDSIMSSSAVKDSTGVAMAVSYGWNFRTGDLNISTPPIQSPIPPSHPAIEPKSIRVLINPRRKLVGNDLSQEIDLIFPGPINPASFNMQDLLLSIDPILGDPSVIVPDGLVTTAVIGTGGETNRIKITITGWPNE